MALLGEAELNGSEDCWYLASISEYRWTEIGADLLRTRAAPLHWARGPTWASNRAAQFLVVKILHSFFDSSPTPYYLFQMLMGGIVAMMLAWMAYTITGSLLWGAFAATFYSFLPSAFSHNVWLADPDGPRVDALRLSLHVGVDAAARRGQTPDIYHLLFDDNSLLDRFFSVFLTGSSSSSLSESLLSESDVVELESSSSLTVLTSILPSVFSFFGATSCSSFESSLLSESESLSSFLSSRSVTFGLSSSLSDSLLESDSSSDELLAAFAASSASLAARAAANAASLAACSAAAFLAALRCFFSCQMNETSENLL